MADIIFTFVLLVLIPSAKPSFVGDTGILVRNKACSLIAASLGGPFSKEIADFCQIVFSNIPLSKPEYDAPSEFLESKIIYREAVKYLEHSKSHFTFSHEKFKLLEEKSRISMTKAKSITTLTNSTFMKIQATLMIHLLDPVKNSFSKYEEKPWETKRVLAEIIKDDIDDMLEASQRLKSGNIFLFKPNGENQLIDKVLRVTYPYLAKGFQWVHLFQNHLSQLKFYPERRNFLQIAFPLVPSEEHKLQIDTDTDKSLSFLLPLKYIPGNEVNMTIQMNWMIDGVLEEYNLTLYMPEFSSPRERRGRTCRNREDLNYLLWDTCKKSREMTIITSSKLGWKSIDIKEMSTDGSSNWMVFLHPTFDFEARYVMYIVETQENTVNNSLLLADDSKEIHIEENTFRIHLSESLVNKGEDKFIIQPTDKNEDIETDKEYWSFLTISCTIFNFCYYLYAILLMGCLSGMPCCLLFYFIISPIALIIIAGAKRVMFGCITLSLVLFLYLWMNFSFLEFVMNAFSFVFIGTLDFIVDYVLTFVYFLFVYHIPFSFPLAIAIICYENTKVEYPEPNDDDNDLFFIFDDDVDYLDYFEHSLFVTI